LVFICANFTPALNSKIVESDNVLILEENKIYKDETIGGTTIKVPSNVQVLIPHPQVIHSFLGQPPPPPEFKQPN